jgi:hypothetical protein
MLSNNFNESLRQKVDFQEDDGDAFGILLEWVYNGELYLEWNMSGWNPILFYVLAYKLCLLDLMDQFTTSHIDASCNDHYFICNPYVMGKAYSGMAGHMRLRNLIVHFLQYVLRGKGRDLYGRKVDISECLTEHPNL